MSDIKLLDCTLRDGGYANDWNFSKEQITSTITSLTDAQIDYVEMGYLTSIYARVGGTQFQSAESASQFIPTDKQQSKFVVMADVSQFDVDTLCHRSESLIDGIRAVFYKRQIEQALSFCKCVVEKGYDLFIQPMVTMDYSIEEYESLIERFCNICNPYAVSIVDSFGCLQPHDVMEYFCALNDVLDENIKIGFHGHDNMLLSQINIISLLELANEREVMVDASVNGIGRGAGNPCTELIAQHLNRACSKQYNIESLISVMSNVTEPISKIEKWGYDPYFLLTAMRRAHPNFATFLLANHDVSVNDFKVYLELIPDEMLSNCTRPYVEELYEQLKLNGRDKNLK